jgi:D-hexose-6-phosphate mutarotase
LQEEKEHILLNENLDLEDRIALEVHHDKEFWLNRVNEHLEKLLEKENMHNQLLRHMAHHYQAQNMIANVKVKQLENKLKEAKKDQKDEGNLEMLVE